MGRKCWWDRSVGGTEVLVGIQFVGLVQINGAKMILAVNGLLVERSYSVVVYCSSHK